MKRNRFVLRIGAVWMLVVHFVDLYWAIMPTHSEHGVKFSLLDLTTFVGIGGFFLAVFGLNMRGAKIVPVKDPRLPESVAFENV